MKKCIWMIRVILQELRMLKFKSILRYVYDARYRADINRLRDLLSGGKLTSQFRMLALREIHFSHDVTYPLWVLKLVRQLADGEELPPIKVIYDQKRNHYIVVDGNHRLMAHKLSRGHSPYVRVRVLTRIKGESNEK